MDGFGTYIPHHSTEGVFLLDGTDDIETMLSLRADQHRLRPPNLNCYIPRHRPITILSSSFGFILSRDLYGSYHVYDPLSNPYAAHMPLPDPDRRWPHAIATPAVLAFRRPPVYPLITENHFYVVCAIHERLGRYDFDTFDSRSRTWTSGHGHINLGGHNTRILLNTGVSCGGRAYWLTNRWQPLIVIHDPRTLTTTFTHVRLSPTDIGPHVRPQLGRIGTYLGLVVVNSRRSPELYLDQSGSWLRLRTMRRLSGVHPLLPLRFESYTLEILFSSADGILQFWESSYNPNWGSRVVNMNVGNSGPPLSIANAVPYVLPFNMPHLDPLRPSPRQELFLDIRIEYQILQVIFLFLLQATHEQQP